MDDENLIKTQFKLEPLESQPSPPTSNVAIKLESDQEEKTFLFQQYSNAASQTTHMKTSTGDKQYQCLQCP